MIVPKLAATARCSLTLSAHFNDNILRTHSFITSRPEDCDYYPEDWKHMDWHYKPFPKHEGILAYY